MRTDITYHAVTDPGCVRDNNEDTFLTATLDDGRVVAAVIDGVGGYEGGEVAAAIARDTILECCRADSSGTDALARAVTEANNAICQARADDPVHAHMSCVLTAVLVDPAAGRLSMAHVGDTRLYQYFDGRLSKLSHDHSLVGYREEIGELTELEAMHHPRRNIVSKVVGDEPLAPGNDYVESAEFPLLPDSTLLLCSDGLCDMITSQSMTEVLASGAPLRDMAEQLVERAKAAGGHDNVTVALVHTAAATYGVVEGEESEGSEEGDGADGTRGHVVAEPDSHIDTRQRASGGDPADCGCRSVTLAAVCAGLLAIGAMLAAIHAMI